MKKSTTKQNKLVWALSIVLVALLAFTSVITFAYFTDNEVADSEMLQFGNLSIELEDGAVIDDALTLTQDAEHKVVPGCSFAMAGNIEITTNIAAFVRVAVTFDVTGGPETAGADLLNLLQGMGEGFVKGEDGAFYMLSTGIKNATVIQDLSDVTIAIPTAWGNVWQDASFTVTLDVKAVQADHLVTNFDPATEGATILTTGEEDIAGGQILVSTVANAFNTVGFGA